MNIILDLLYLLANSILIFGAFCFMYNRESAIIKDEPIVFKILHFIFLYLSCSSLYFIFFPLGIVLPGIGEKSTAYSWFIAIITTVIAYFISKRKMNIIIQYLIEALALATVIIILNNDSYTLSNDSFTKLYISITYWILIRLLPLIISSARVIKQNFDISISEFLFLIDYTIISYAPIYTPTLFEERNKIFLNTLEDFLTGIGSRLASPSEKAVKEEIENAIRNKYSSYDYLSEVFSSKSPAVVAYDVITEICFNACASGKYHFKFGMMYQTGQTYRDLYVKALNMLVKHHSISDFEKCQRIMKITEIICKTPPIQE